MVETDERYGVVIRVHPRLAKIIKALARQRGISVFQASKEIADLLSKELGKPSDIQEVLRMLI